MIDLWVDIMIANGADNEKNKNAQKKINYMRFIYKKYQIDSTRFMNSNIYYTSKIDEYEKMFEEVSSKLKQIKKTYAPFAEDEDEDPRMPLVKRDSIRNGQRTNKQKNRQENLLDK